MSNEEIIETQGDYRVKLVMDDYADEPYDDGQTPILRLEYRGYWHAEHVQVGGRPTDDDSRIEEAARRWWESGGDDRLFEKYLRAYYGVSQVYTYRSDAYTYVTYDSAAWRKYAGFRDNELPPAGSVNMDEYKAWIEGDVYGYVVEKRVTWTPINEPLANMETWEEVDSCWGYFGYDYARKSALAALNLELQGDAA